MTALDRLVADVMRRYRVSRQVALGYISQGSMGTPQPPSAPTGLIAVPGDTKIQLTWNPVDDATSYSLYFSTSPGVTPATGTELTNVTAPYTHTSRVNGTPYYYVLTALNNLGESDPSDEVTATPAADVPDYYIRSVGLVRNSVSDFTGYQTKLVLNSTNMSFDKADPNGVNFRIWTDSTKTTPVPFAIESWNAGAEQALVWVKPVSDATSVVIEYGNDEYEETASSPANTFDFFDDFESGETVWFPFGSDSMWSGAFCPDDNRIYYFGRDDGSGSGNPMTYWYDVDTGNCGFAKHLGIPVVQSGVIWNPATKRFHIYGGRRLSDGIKEDRIQWYDPTNQSSGYFEERMPRAITINGVGYFAGEYEFYLFGGVSTGYLNNIVQHKPDPEGGLGSCTDSGAVLPSARAGVAVIWDSTQELFVLLGGGRSGSPGAVTDILTYDPTTPTVNPIASGDVLPHAVMDLACVRTDAGVIYGFGGHNWAADPAYLNAIVKYTPGDDAETVVAVVGGRADDYAAVIRPSDDLVVLGPVNHTDQEALSPPDDENNEQYQIVMYLFDTSDDSISAEPVLPADPPDNVVDCGNHAAPFSSRAIGGTKVIQTDYTNGTHVGAYRNFGKTFTGKYTCEAWVEMSHTNKEFSIKLTDTNNATSTGSNLSVGFLRTGTNNQWNAFWSGTNQPIGAVPGVFQHIIGMHFDTASKQLAGSIQRGIVSTARNFLNDLAVQRFVWHTAGSDFTTSWMVDKLVVRKWVGFGGVEPICNVGSEIPVWT